MLRPIWRIADFSAMAAKPGPLSSDHGEKPEVAAFDRLRKTSISLRDITLTTGARPGPASFAHAHMIGLVGSPAFLCLTHPSPMSWSKSSPSRTTPLLIDRWERAAMVGYPLYPSMN